MAFPTVVLLDSFEREEKPLSNGSKWTVINGFKTTGNCGTGGWNGTGGTEEGEDGAYWNVHTYVEPVVAVKVGGSLAAENSSMYLYACLSTPTTTEKSGYRFKLFQGSTASNEQLITLERMVKGAFTTLGTFKMKASESNTVALKDSLALQVVKGKVVAWHKKLEAGEWKEVLSVADTTFTTGNVGMGSNALKEKTPYTINKFEVGQTATKKVFGVLFNHVLDTFRRTAEKPLSNGGKWAEIGGATAAGEIASNRYTATSGFPTENGAYWTELPSVASPLVSAEVAELVSSEERYVVLWACMSEPASSTEKSGYKLKVEREKTSGLYKITTALMNKATLSNETNTEKVELLKEDHIGIEVKGGKVKALHKVGGEAWTTVHEKADSTFTTGYTGVGAAGTGTAFLNNFAIEPLGLEGHLERKINHALKGVLSFAGSIVNRMTERDLAGKLSFAGSLVPELKTGIKVLTATLSFAGSLPRSTTHTILAKLRLGMPKRSVAFVRTSAEVIESANGSSKLVVPITPGSVGNTWIAVVNTVSETAIPAITDSAGDSWSSDSSHTYLTENFLARVLSTTISSTSVNSITVSGLTAGADTKVAVYEFSGIEHGVRRLHTQTSLKSSTETGKVETTLTAEELVSTDLLFGAFATNTKWTKYTPGESATALAKLTDTNGTLVTQYLLSPTENVAGKASGKYEPTAPLIKYVGYAVAYRAEGIFNLLITHGLTGTLSFLGALGSSSLRKLTGALSFKGELDRNTDHTLTASLPFLGSLGRSTGHPITASLSFLGGLPRATVSRLSAGLTFAGSLRPSSVRTLLAKLSFTGSLPRNTSYSLAAKLSFLGTAQRSTARSLAATLSFLGSLRPATIKNFIASLSFTGTLPRQTTHQLKAALSLSTRLLDFVVFPLHASLSFSGSMRRSIEKFTAGLAFSGELPRNIKHQLPASLSFLGSLARFVTHPLSGSLSFAGNVTRKVAHTLTAKLEFEGRLGHDILHVLAASLSFTGALPRNILHQLRASLEFAGSLVPKISEFLQKLVASLTFSGALPRDTVRQESASLSSEGALGKDISHATAGVLSFAGAFSPRIRRALAASLSFAGSIPSRATTRALTAALTFAGSVRGTATKQLEATLTFAGTSRRNIKHALSGELSFSGFLRLTGEFVQRFNASLNFSGTLPRSIRHALAASLTFEGSLRRSIVHALEGSLGATGALQRAISHQLAGSLGVSGETSRKIYTRLTASVTFVGTTGRSIVHELRAALSLTGSLVPQIKLVQVFVASLSFNGRITGTKIRHALTATLSFFGSLNFEKVFGIRPIPDILLRKQSEFPTLTLRRRESGEVYGLVNHLEGYPEMEVQSVVRRRQVFGRKG